MLRLLILRAPKNSSFIQLQFLSLHTLYVGIFLFLLIIFGGRGWRALRDASKDTSHRLEEFYPSTRWAPPLKQGRSWRGKKLSLYFRGTSEAEGVNTPRNDGICIASRIPIALLRKSGDDVYLLRLPRRTEVLLAMTISIL